MDTSVLWVEWLGVEHVKLEVVGSSAAARKARVYLPSGVSPSVKFFSICQPFFHPVFGFLRNLITADLVFPVQIPAVMGV